MTCSMRLIMWCGVVLVGLYVLSYAYLRYIGRTEVIFDDSSTGGEYRVVVVEKDLPSVLLSKGFYNLEVAYAAKRERRNCRIIETLWWPMIKIEGSIRNIVLQTFSGFCPA